MKLTLRILSAICFALAICLVGYKFLFSTATSNKTDVSSQASTTSVASEQTSATTSVSQSSTVASTPETSSVATSTSTPATPITVTIEEGDLSPDVARKLREAGIITDEQALVDYLVSNNIAELVQIGSFELTPGMTPEEIAKIITNQ